MPSLIYDQSLVDRAMAESTQRGQVWRYQGPDARVASNAGRVAVATKDELAELPDTGDVLVTTALLDAEDWTQEAQSRSQFLLTIEHFVHLESINALSWPSGTGVVIEVAVGPARFGGRPGRDTVDLARAVVQQDRVPLVGVSAYVHSLGMADSLLQTRDQLVDAGLPCELVTVHGPHDVCGQLPAGLEVRHDADAIIGTSVRVIGRPSLETAVIDIGEEAGLVPRTDVVMLSDHWATPLAIRVRQTDRHRALLTLPEEAHELVIGDPCILDLVPTRWFKHRPVAQVGPT